MNTSPLGTLKESDIFNSFDLVLGTIGNRPRTERRLSDLRGSFRDKTAYEAALAAGDPLLYAVTAVEPASGDGQMHFGLGILYPGKIKDEYFLTKGHYHASRAAAEVYIGLKGEGMMLLEDEATGASRMVPMQANSAVYVPGHTAHRTVNTGSEPLVYLGIYPANAGHDYGAIAARNFSMVIVEKDNRPVMEPR